MTDATSTSRFTYSLVGSSLHDQESLASVVAPVLAMFAAEGGSPADPEDDPASPHLLIVATGGTEHRVLELAARRHRVAPYEPTMLVAHGGENSLPASLESLAALRRHGHRGRIVMLDGQAGRGRLLDALVDLEAIRRFHTARLALVGGASDWLVASTPDHEVVARRWGPTIDVIDPGEMIGGMPGPDDPVAVEITQRFSDAPDAATGSVPRAEIESAARVGSVLSRLVEGHDAVSVRCFDLLGSVHTSGCLALAQLNERGVTAGCEGDLPSTIAMMWARYLLDRPSWMANPARIDEATNELVLAHCTIDPAMTDGFTLDTHFESGIGVGIRGHLPPQPVTLVRLGGAELDRVWIAEGRIQHEQAEAHLCRTQVAIRLTDRSVAELLRDPLGNHIVVIPGHHHQRLRDWWDLAIA